jgi:hypothetical protein
MRNAAGFLTQFRRKHLLHECLASKVGNLGLSGYEGSRPWRADCCLILHLAGSGKNDILALI